MDTSIWSTEKLEATLLLMLGIWLLWLNWKALRNRVISSSGRGHTQMYYRNQHPVFYWVEWTVRAVIAITILVVAIAKFGN